MKLKPWIQVVEPHADIRTGRFDESVFAADIGAVLADRGAMEYRDPELFFKKTYFTKEISALISSILLRLSGKKGIEPVVQLQTPFGGGKTHTLLTVYHLVKHGEAASKFSEIKKILKDDEIKEIPDAKVAVIPGDAINANVIRTTKEGIQINTLWGEIAYQLGGEKLYKVVKDDDEKRISPGTNKLMKIISSMEPVIILLDETTKYLTKASGITVGESTLAGQTISFMQELTEAIANSEKSIVIATLVSSARDLSDENEEKLYQRLAKVFGRVEAIKEPVKGEEIYEIVRKRLFENIGSETEAKEVAAAYWEFYQDNKEDFPRNVREVDYKRLIEKAYPFHPETINVLREKWGTIPEFQKTRGILRLLALVVGDLYRKKHSGYLIQPSNINLGNPEILSELLKYTGRQFDGVVASDIAGHSAKAPHIDRELGSEYAKESITEGLATAVFMHSFSAKSDNGAPENVLRLSILHPDIAPAIFADVLNRARDRFYYLDERNGVYRFSDAININKRIVDKEDEIKKEDIVKFAQDRMWDLLGGKFAERNRFPESDTDIPDVPKSRLVVLSLEHTKGKNTWKETEEFIVHMLNNHGTKHRKFKNCLVFLIPDESQQQQLLKTIKRYLALVQINEEYKNRKGLSEEQKRDLQFKIRALETDLPTVIASTYRHIVMGDNSHKLKSVDMGAIVYSHSNPISSVVWQNLKDSENLAEKIDPNLLVSAKWSLWPRDKDSIDSKTLWEYFCQYTHLPILADENVLKACIAQGILRGLFGYALGDGKKFEKPVFNRFVDDSEIEIADSSWLIKPEIAVKLLPKEERVSIKEVKPGTATTIILEKLKEREKGMEAKKVKELSFDASLDWQAWDNFFTYILSPLTDENAVIKIELNFQALAEEGIPQGKIDAIVESLSQICKKLQINKK